MKYKLDEIQSAKVYNVIHGSKINLNYWRDFSIEEIKILIEILDKSWGGYESSFFPKDRIELILKNGETHTLDVKHDQILLNSKSMHWIEHKHHIDCLIAENDHYKNKTLNLLLLKNTKPTIDWIRRMANGDSMFTSDGIRNSEPILDEYITKLLSIIKEEVIKKEIVYDIVKETMVKLNKVDSEHNKFIETIEREELIDYLKQGAKIVGIDISTFDDDTVKWRNW